MQDLSSVKRTRGGIKSKLSTDWVLLLSRTSISIPTMTAMEQIARKPRYGFRSGEDLHPGMGNRARIFQYAETLVNEVGHCHTRLSLLELGSLSFGKFGWIRYMGMVPRSTRQNNGEPPMTSLEA